MALFGCLVFAFLSGAAFTALGRRHLDTTTVTRSVARVSRCSRSMVLGEQVEKIRLINAGHLKNIYLDRLPEVFEII